MCKEHQEASPVAQHEQLLLRLLALSRVAALCQAGFSLAFTWRQLAEPQVAAGVLGLLVAENMWLVRCLARHGRLDRRALAVLDVCIGMAAMAAVVMLLKPVSSSNTDDFLYPYSVASMAVIGLVFRQLATVVIVPTVAALGYLGVTFARVAGHARADLLINAITYWTWAVASWLLAAGFRKLGIEMGKARDAAAAREAELARERERSRHARELHVVELAMAQRERERAMLSRDLHDRVLQTLEFMGREGWISDARIRDHVAAEAVWLRELVHSELDRPVAGLAAALDQVVAWQTDAGMRIEMNAAGLGAEKLPEEMISALAGAVTELLTNVRKHAGTNRAVLRAFCTPELVTITVLDHGRGFDPIRVNGGLGLRESVIARIRHVGGRVMVTSEPDVGTHVAITVPRQPDEASAKPATRAVSPVS